ncbi:MAG: hypothetical protein EA390_03875 [Balneolaceae bacterium]|nr:MAG: hypothetical protein EA390_03875 [Balneolaceae bacterium]
MKLTVNQKLSGWIILGLTGFLLFAVLKDRFDFMANAPVNHSKETAIEMAKELFTNLGIEYNDTLGVVPFRMQRVGLYRSIRDSLGDDSPTPADLNRDGFHLHGWEVVAATTLSINESFNLTPGSIYGATGVYRTKLDNSGRVRYFELNPDRGAKSILLGENNREFASAVVQDIFGYDLNEYDFMETDKYDEDVSPIREEQIGERVPILEPNDDRNLYRWVKSSGLYNDYIELELQPAVHREGTESDQTEIRGVSVMKFEAYNEIEKVTISETDQYFIVFFFILVAILVLFVFIEGFGQLFKGKVDWKRISIVTLIIAICTYGWRFIFMLNFSDLLSLQANVVVQFNQVIFGLVIGGFAAIAYIGWEAYARGEKKFQINLIDAFWRGKFFLNETGSAIIKGFSLSGILLGITALFLTISGSYLYQADSQFGFTEILNRPFFLSLNMSVLTVAALCSVAMIGVIYNFFNKRLRNRNLIFTLSILLGGVLFAGLGRSFGTEATLTHDIALFVLLAVPLFSAYKLSGVVTVFCGVWLFTSIANILPYMQSPAPDVVSNAWIQLVFAGSILLFGIAAYRYGPSLTTVSSYIPDYERKLMRNLRFENEMLIARKTQEKLMPLRQPETDEFELYGYFMPSYEVGGDYFDYVTGTDMDGENHLTLTVVDVSGKSMRAAMHAVFTSGLLRSRMYTDQPSKILREISPVIYEKTDSKTFITCIVGRYVPKTKTLKLANAGHCLPILKRDNKTQFLHTPEPKYPFGVRKNVDYHDVSLKLKSGDLILFYSDGFPEAVNEQGKRIGFDKALQLVESLDTDKFTAKEVCNKIREYIQQYSIERLADDTTILCLKIK